MNLSMLGQRRCLRLKPSIITVPISLLPPLYHLFSSLHVGSDVDGLCSTAFATLMHDR